MNHPTRAIGFGLLLLGTSSLVFASRGSSMPTMSSPEKTPQQRAADLYNAGLKSRDRAMKSLKEAKESPDAEERAKLEGKAKKEFEKAISKFQEATKLNPRFHQAYSDLGFSLRKSGDYNAALQAYGQALALAPGYTPAIEYRAEAYLALNKLEDAKQAYVQLFPSDRSHADELMQAMKAWLETRRSEPGDVAPGTLQDFDLWVAQRDEIAKQTPSVSQLQKRPW